MDRRKETKKDKGGALVMGVNLTRFARSDEQGDSANVIPSFDEKGWWHKAQPHGMEILRRETDEKRRAKCHLC